MSRALRTLLLLWVVASASGCATLPPGGGQNPADPLESWNRGVAGFNDGLDDAVLKPVATAYVNVVPRLVRTGIDNFFNNGADAWSAINNVLQYKPEGALHDTRRVGTNTLLGLGGLLDIASEMGIERRGEDLGQTLGHWGIPSGPYIVWPLLGPSTLRESFSLVSDRLVSPVGVFGDERTRNALIVVSVVNVRANLLGATRLLDDIALDKYTFIRDAYLQRRRSLIYDGNPPEEPAEAEPPAAPAN